MDWEQLTRQAGQRGHRVHMGPLQAERSKLSKRSWNKHEEQIAFANHNKEVIGFVIGFVRVNIEAVTHLFPEGDGHVDGLSRQRC